MGVQVCLVIGGGNIFRGVSAAASGMDRAQADHMGMLATVHERPGYADIPREARNPDPSAIGHPHGERLRAIHQAAGGNGTWRRAGW